MNDYQRFYPKQRGSEEKTTYSCIVYADEPNKYSIVLSKRLSNIDENGYGIIKELGKSYRIRVEQTGTQQSMERYGMLLEKAIHSELHKEVPSDCEDWKQNQSKINRIHHPTVTSTYKTTSSITYDRLHTTALFSPTEKEFSLATVPFKKTLSPTNREANVLSGLKKRRINELTNDIYSDGELPEVDEVEYQERNEKAASNEVDPSEKFSTWVDASMEKLNTEKKWPKKTHRKFTGPKRLKVNSDENHNSNKVARDDHDLLNYLKKINVLLDSLHKRTEQTTITLDRQEKFLKILCNNQKKIAKQLVKRQVPVNLDEDEENEMNKSSSLSEASTYTRSDGLVIDFMKVYGTRQNTNKYALKLVDLFFIDKKEFQNIDVKNANQDPRIKAIYDAVKRKFDYSANNMSIIWPTVHESILSKRRNQKRAAHLIQSGANGQLSISNTDLTLAVDSAHNQQEITISTSQFQ